MKYSYIQIFVGYYHKINDLCFYQNAEQIKQTKDYNLYKRMKQQKFTSKFKDKISFIHKHGWKQTIESIDSTQPNFSRVNSHHDNHQYNTQNKDAYSPLRNNRKMHTIVDMPDIYQKNRKHTLNHNKKMSLFSNNQKDSKKNTIMVNEDKYREYYEQPKHKKSLNEDFSLSHNRSYQQNPTHMESTSMSRNPQIQLLMLRLREKQKQKIKKAQAPKYIDQMLVKHQNLFKMYDTKNSSKWKHRQELSERKMQESIIKLNSQNISLSRVTSHQEPVPQNIRLIKLKKIQQLIQQTKKNSEKEHSQSPQKNDGNSPKSKKAPPQFIFASLRHSRVQKGSLKKPQVTVYSKKQKITPIIYRNAMVTNPYK